MNLKSLLSGSLPFLLLALVWVGYDPALSLLTVWQLEASPDEREALEASLLARGRGSVWALRRGLQGQKEEGRLRCAAVLAAMGDAEGEMVLLQNLSQTGQPAQARVTASLLLSVWDQRNGPREKELLAGIRAEEGGGNAQLQANRERLDKLLALHPAWAGGYVARARLNLAVSELDATRQDALTALMLAPDHFEAMVLLGRCLLLLNQYEQALLCIERAVLVHPHLRPSLEKELQAARIGTSTLRSHRRVQASQDAPVG